MHKIYDINTTNTLFDLNTNPTRTNEFKINKPRVETKMYQFFFTNRVINTWNKLPSSIVLAESLNVFKIGVDKHFEDLVYATRLDYA